MSDAELLPVFLRLEGREVVLVGGGSVAGSKLESLLRTKARVTVVAPRIQPSIRESGATLVERAFVPSDLDHAFFAIAAATPLANREVRLAAEDRRVFLNAVDDPQSASAFMGGVLRRGSVTVAVSTGGQAPALAGLLREALDAVLPDEVEGWVTEAKALRLAQRREAVPMKARRPLLLRALNELYFSEDSTPDAHKGSLS